MSEHEQRVRKALAMNEAGHDCSQHFVDLAALLRDLDEARAAWTRYRDASRRAEDESDALTVRAERAEAERDALRAENAALQRVIAKQAEKMSWRNNRSDSASSFTVDGA